MVEASGVYKKHIIKKTTKRESWRIQEGGPTPQPFEIPPMLIIIITFKKYNRFMSYLIVLFNDAGFPLSRA
jgi:hypothetical protein